MQLIIIISCFAISIALLSLVIRNLVINKEPFKTQDALALLGIVVSILFGVTQMPASSFPFPGEVTPITFFDKKTLLTENFEDGDANGFVAERGTWRVVDDGADNKVLEVKSDSSVTSIINFGPELDNYILESRVRLIDFDPSPTSSNGIVSLQFRISSGNRYAFLFDLKSKYVATNYVTNNERDWVSLKDTPYEMQKNIWYSVKIENQASQINTYVNGVSLASIQDSKLSKGSFAFNAGTNMTVQFDDVYIARP